ncbi:MAG: hypothetical protein JXB46_08065, partial [Candidatus Eisenbacteria bacterium]|nr:hypothetical protein [Candidatus Eisenbacteria bacterium]
MLLGRSSRSLLSGIAPTVVAISCFLAWGIAAGPAGAQDSAYDAALSASADADTLSMADTLWQAPGPEGSDSLGALPGVEGSDTLTVVRDPAEGDTSRLRGDDTSRLPDASAFQDTLRPGGAASDGVDAMDLGAPATVSADTTNAAATDTSIVAPPRRVPLDPYRTGIRSIPSINNEFLRPWTLMWRPGSGPGHEPVALPTAAPSGTPFRRELMIDLERDRVALLTRVGDDIVWVSYASPLADYERVRRGNKAAATWERMTLEGLGRASALRDKGLLDIDIPMPLPGPFARAIGTGANLKVRGSERITFGGQSRYLVQALPTESGEPSRFPQLDMQQQLTVNLEGTIGRKIHVYVDHRSAGDTFGAGAKTDQIRVRYDGDEDEIIQKIELGEVNLSLPGTEFVSFSGSHQGLFGAKMTAKLGKLDVISVASKQEGKSSSASFTGTSESDSLVIKDISYKGDVFFIIDSMALKYSNVGIQNVKVYVDDRTASNDIEDNAQPGFAYLRDPDGAAHPDTTSGEPVGPNEQGNFVELVETEDYYIPQSEGLYGEGGYQTGMIILTRPIQNGRVLAVSYDRVVDGTVSAAVGGYNGEYLYLKLIRQYDTGNPAWAETRLYELKNVYDLGATQIPEDGFQFTIRKKSASGQDPEVDDSGVRYTKILGLDTEDPGVGSSVIDPRWVDLDAGLLMFPHYTPFCPGYDTTVDSTGFYYVPGHGPDPIYYADEFDDSEKNCLVYSRDTFQAGDDKYYFVVKYNRPKTTFSLDHANIIEDSEVVRLNGVKLARGTDYTIYYPSGQLTILAEEAKEPEARITVEYDYKPFGIAGEKTLLGTRAVYNWSDKIKLGTTWMYQSKGTPDDRPRLGEEPSRTVVGDVNLSADFTPDVLTTLVDAIPFVDTDAESRLKISAEAAVSIPNPNTKGFVAIDDMEGVDNVSMLGVSRLLWDPASVPDVPFEMPPVEAAKRESINWFNPDRRVHEVDLHPNLEGTSEADDTHT